jgi:hypothetical protein
MLFRFPTAIRIGAAACAAIASFTAASAEKPAAPRHVIYNAGTDAPALDQSAARSFSDKYQVVTVRPSGGFVRARLKGHSIYPLSSADPRPMRETKTIAKASVGFVVTPEGLVTDVRVLESTDKRVADFLVKQIVQRRFAPAQYRGAAVPSLEHTEARFGPADERDYSSMFKNGLGIMGSRDR